MKAVIADTVSLDLYHNRDYQALPYAGGSSVAQSNVTTAENFALRMMLMDNLVFGYTKFEIKDKMLFSDNTNTDMSKIKRCVEFEGNSNNFNGGVTVGNIIQTVCVTVTTTTLVVNCHYQVNQCPDIITNILGPCDHCLQYCASTSTITSTQCVTWDDGEGGGGTGWPEFPSGGGGGNPGGGSTSPCTITEAILESVVPVSCPAIPNPWPPAPTQQQLDLDWMNTHIKDSTNNPCVANTLATLKNISAKLPALLRNVFHTAAIWPIDITFKMAYSPSEYGAITERNLSNFNYKVTINNRFQSATDLAVAATIIHETFHCQLMAWYRKAVLLNDTTLKRELTEKYGYLFTNEYMQLDSNLIVIATGPGPLQHQDIAIRYRDMIGTALYQFAIAKGINVNLEYCKNLAWTGCQDSRAFNALGQTGSDNIRNLINAEKDPFGFRGINPNPNTNVGTTCL